MTGLCQWFWSPTAAGEALRAAIITLFLLGLIAAADGWQRCAAPPAEVSRKAVHVGAGMVVAGLPWLFRSVWPVAGLGLLFALVLAAARRGGVLRSIHCVERRSAGDVCFLLAAIFLFLVGRGRPALYLIAVLIVTFADSAAALVGQAWGRRAYTIGRERRTLEGSAAFLVAAFTVACLVLLLTPLDRATCVLIALQVALLTASVEAISLRGSDNLTVPVAAFYTVVALAPHPAAFIARQLIAQLLILAAVALASRLAAGSVGRWRRLSTRGVIGGHLLLYGVWVGAGPLGLWLRGLP